MNQGAMLHDTEPMQILKTAIEKKVPAIMTYLSRGKWHVAKVLLTQLTDDKLGVEAAHPGARPHPINIRVHQPVGISFKYEYGKFIFDTTVVALEPSPAPAGGGLVILVPPDAIEVVQRRSYFRVYVPGFLKVNVLLWHRSRSQAEHESEQHLLRGRLISEESPTLQETLPKRLCPSREGGSYGDGAMSPQGRQRNKEYVPQNYCQGRLVDISAGGAQVLIPHWLEAGTDVGKDSTGMVKPEFKKGQFVGMRFTPMPYEMPLMLNAQIRNILPAAEDEGMYLGLQIVGLEASPEGRRVLTRLVGVVERYFRINQTGVKLQDMRPDGSGSPLCTNRR